MDKCNNENKLNTVANIQEENTPYEFIYDGIKIFIKHKEEGMALETILNQYFSRL